MLSRKTYIALAILAVQVVVLILLGRGSRREESDVLPKIVAKDIQEVVLTKGKDVVKLVRKIHAAPAVPSTTPDGGVKAAKKEDDWELEKPARYPADKSAVKTLLSRLEKMSVSSQPISRKKEWHDSKFGVGDKNAWKVELFGKGHSSIATFLLGKSQGGRTFLRRPGEDAVYQATGIMAYAFNKKPYDWRDKTIYKLDQKQITKIEIRGKETVVLSRDPRDAKRWRLDEPRGIRLDQTKAKGIVRTFASLRAKTFAPGAKDSDTGLAKPEAVVTAHGGGKTWSLLVGKKKGKYDRYVKRPDQKTVFVVGSWQADQLTRKAKDLKAKEPVIPKPPAAQVRRIVISKKGSRVTLARTGTGWRITAPLQAEADHTSVEALLREVNRLNVPQRTWGDKKKHAEFQLDAAGGLRVELYGAGGKRLSGLVIGKRDRGQTYLRKLDDDKVYKAYGLNRARFDKKPGDWRNRILLSFKVGDAQAVELGRGGKALRLVRAGKAWKIEKPVTAPADQKKMSDLLATLSNLHAAGFAPATPPGQTGLASPTLRVSVEVKGQGKRTVLVGKKTPKGQLYAQRSGSKQLYLLAGWQLPRIDKKLDDLKKK